MAEDYTRGQMDITHQHDTFVGAMKVSVFITILLSLIVLYLTLVFAAGQGWVSALIVSLIAGGVSGLVLKQGALYWFSLGVLAVITVISGGVTMLIAGMMAGGQ
ncbi:aa3-type cytochrome c oxidase subunit IV [Alkalicaulis satelles]|uniref:Aa3-type cytochrome c oxidase subunit IV n=1 Tax=Alkalicaulis satelles TaxID=2609175 RepID=A0A5M6ZJI9_9PROT|nr:aa3-type cytochrome c oxidase subunit IV [Alkalicaulis satelles]KAA5803418.1 aa3-type cytochrome c oxidase subunit IV [Alkalicaulis satelles]